MRLTATRLSFTLAALGFLGGCAGSASPQSIAPSGPNLSIAPPPFRANHYGEDWIISAQPYGDAVNLYKQSGAKLKFQAKLTWGISLPRGLAAATNGYWYVSNAGHSNVLLYRVQKYSVPQYPSETLVDDGQLPDGVAATLDRNLVAVSNLSTTGSGGGSVSVYLNRQTEPSRVLTYGSHQLQGQGVAVDAQGNCFWSFNDANPNSGSIVEFAGCNGGGSVVVSGISRVRGIAIDDDDNLYYADEADGVHRCIKTSKCSLWASNATYGFGGPEDISIDGKGKTLWLADATGYLWAIGLNRERCEGKGTGELCVHRYRVIGTHP
jgi:DNA-binding beta-propeller fold protein YncE